MWFWYQSNIHLIEYVAVFPPFCYSVRVWGTGVNSSLHVWYHPPVKPSGPRLLFTTRSLITEWFILFTCYKSVQNFCFFLSQFCSSCVAKILFISSWLSNFFGVQLLIVFSYNSFYFCKVNCNVPTFVYVLICIVSCFFLVILAKHLSTLLIFSKITNFLFSWLLFFYSFLHSHIYYFLLSANFGFSLLFSNN